MKQEPKYQQLQMIWPIEQSTPDFNLPDGYKLKSFQDGDEAGFFHLMNTAGLGEWNDDKLSLWKDKILPNGWFFILHEKTQSFAATAMATKNPSEYLPNGGELGWVAGDPKHKGKGLGRIVCAAVVKRYLESNYKEIYLKTDDFRLPAVQSYLNLGFVPLLIHEEMAVRWEKVYAKLGRTVDAKLWRSI